MAEKKVHPDMGVGEFIRRQRELGQMSVRQLADMCGVSNAYLSQIERGLRSPSSVILQSLAKGLRLSAETLYAQAGIMDPKGDEEDDVIKSVMRDPHLSPRQREILIDMYHSFRKVNETATPP
jgi:transcriptional regulator with XRE-family HTH domain